MKTPNFFLLLLICLVTACNQPANDLSEADNTTDEAKEQVFGEVANFGNPMDYNSMVAQIMDAPTDTMDVTVQGSVDAVCQGNGCWLTINGDEEMMVKFKDYGFFVPKDIGGRDVVMHGKAYYQVTPVEELQHYAEDAGKSAEEIAEITEPKRELRFMAEGVKLLNK